MKIIEKKKLREALNHCESRGYSLNTTINYLLTYSQSGIETVIKFLITSGRYLISDILKEWGINYKINEFVYEVVDKTAEEVYFSLGLFTSLDYIIKELHNFPNDERISDFNDDDYEVIIIWKRKIGWEDEGIEVYKLVRELSYKESEEGVWEIIEEKIKDEEKV